MQRKITFQNVIPLTHTLILSTLVNSITVYVTWTHEGGYKWYHLFLLPFRHISVLTEEKETCLYLSPETLPLFIDWERMDVLLLSMFSLPCGTAQLLSYFSTQMVPSFHWPHQQQKMVLKGSLSVSELNNSIDSNKHL